MRSLILYRNAFIVSLSLIGTLTLLLFFHFFFILPGDFANYNRMKAMKNELKHAHAQSEQTSECVQKDIWLAQEGKRLHHKITSERSRITFVPKGHHYEVVEKMERLTGSMQEKVEEKGETVRLFSASRGLYHYGSNQFYADNVKLDLIDRPLLPISKTEEKMLLTGTASSMMLHLSDHRPQIAVDKLQATLPGGP